LLAIVTAFATLVGAWMFRYENFANGSFHRNRLTGAVCHSYAECWSGNILVPAPVPSAASSNHVPDEWDKLPDAPSSAAPHPSSSPPDDWVPVG
jgi:hypothetical protein